MCFLMDNASIPDPNLATSQKVLQDIRDLPAALLKVTFDHQDLNSFRSEIFDPNFLFQVVLSYNICKIHLRFKIEGKVWWSMWGINP